ncbi:phosphotransferase family protein [Streptomyces sp. NPDC051219]|uniref:phosphotransferase family protein n=1 Tax=Streptomyces sp. NPDC051219 TaxID=3155283 RepID=UPI00341D19A9
MTLRTTDIAAALVPVLRDALATPVVDVSDLARYGDGHSGDTYSFVVTTDSSRRQMVLRLSPFGVAPKGPADVGRQGRIMASLSAAGAPAPRVIASSSEPALAGRAFAVMELVEGRAWSTFREVAGDVATAQAAVAALKAIQAVPVTATSLSGDPYEEDPAFEVRRWGPLIDRSQEELHQPGMALATELTARVGDAGAVTSPVVVHGDFHYGNLLFDDTSVVTVLDWEIATVGHPVTDLACLAVASMRRRYAPDPNPTGSVEVSLPDLAEIYGVDPTRFAWHVAASCYKYAAILGYNLNLHRRGKKHDPIYESLQHTACGLLDDGLELLRDGPDSL